MNNFTYYKIHRLHHPETGQLGYGIIRVYAQKFNCIIFDTSLMEIRRIYGDLMKNTDKLNRRIYE